MRQHVIARNVITVVCLIVCVPELVAGDNESSIEWIGIKDVQVNTDTCVTSVQLPPMKSNQRALVLLPIGRTRLMLKITHCCGPDIQIDGLANEAGAGIESQRLGKDRPSIEVWTRTFCDHLQYVSAFNRNSAPGATATFHWQVIDTIPAK